MDRGRYEDMAPSTSARRRSDPQNEIGSADDPLGHGEVDGPARAHRERLAELTRWAEGDLADPKGKHLRVRAQSERVAAHHPRTVPGDLAAPDRGEAEDDRDGHERTEQQPEAVQES